MIHKAPATPEELLAKYGDYSKAGRKLVTVEEIINDLLDARSQRCWDDFTNGHES
jgi:hypothetical protein